MNWSFYFTLLFIGSNLCLGQSAADKQAIKLVRKAEKAIKERKFELGEELLLNAIGKDSTYADAYVKLFELFNRLQQSAKIYQYQLLYVRYVPKKWLKPQIWQSLAYHEMARGEYAQAKNFLSKVRKKDSLLYHSIEFGIRQLNDPDTLVISELPASINKFDYQYLPVLTVDDQTLIYTARENDQSDEDIVQSTFDGKNWSEAQPISKIINSPYNEGACTISADGRTLIFTSCEGRRGVGNCDLFISRKVRGEWSLPKNLGKNVNSKFWDSQPSLSADGKTLYFVSTKPGGKGGRDIWVTKFVKGRWEVAKNLGPQVNTQRDETTPFIHSNNETLFFSSNGHIGMGGFDLMKGAKFNDGWGEVENLGYPINTFHDEVSLFITSDGSKAYFTKEDKLEQVVVSSKLVSYVIPANNRLVSGVTYITGKVMDANTKNPLEATLELVDISTRESLFNTESDALTGRYFLVLSSGKNFAAFIEKPGYLFEDLSFVATVQKSVDTLDIFLHPIEVGAKTVLANIYFAFDSDALDQKSDEELYRIVKLLRKYPSIKVEISGHTDNVGTYKYNQNLSERRAKKVHDFLINTGIKKHSISFKGYAHTQPITTNETKIKRAKNRRIEFKIVSYSSD